MIDNIPINRPGFCTMCHTAVHQSQVGGRCGDHRRRPYRHREALILLRRVALDAYGIKHRILHPEQFCNHDYVRYATSMIRQASGSAIDAFRPAQMPNWITWYNVEGRNRGLPNFGRASHTLENSEEIDATLQSRTVFAP